MKEIIINSPKYGKHIIFVDDEDFELINKYRWCVNKTGNNFYVTANAKKNNKQTIKIHRLIMKCLDKPNKQIDHIDGNGLNNCKINLRFVNNSQNQMNSKARNRYKGIRFNRRIDKWIASINKNGRHKGLGYFDDPVEAAKAYDLGAIKYFGEYAKLNFDKSNYGVLENRQSEVKIRKTSSKYRGVSFHKTKNKWISYVVINYKLKHLGYFRTEKGGAVAYNNFVIENKLNRKLNIIKERM